MADWSKLPLDLAIEIAEKIEYCEDFIKGFYLVCKRWKTAFAPVSSRLTPLLMFVEPNGEGDGLWQRSGHLYSLDKCGVVGHVELPHQASIRLDDDDDNNINVTPLFTCTRGWLLHMNDTFSDIVLTHPFSNETIQCPQIPYDLAQEYINFRERGVDHVMFALSASPSEFEYSLAMFCRGHQVVAVWRNTQKEWLVKRFSERIMDIIFYRGDLCYVNDEGKVFDFSSNKNITSESLWQQEDLWNEYINLVESDGKLLIVLHQRMDLCITVWEVNVDDGHAKEAYDLGENSIFLGHNNSAFSMNTKNSSSIWPNCVYYVLC